MIDTQPSSKDNVESAFQTDDGRMLFDSIDRGFCIVEVLFDEDQRPEDYRFLKVNDAFEEQTGLVSAVGRTMRSLRTDHEDHWYRIYGQVALTGEPVRFREHAETLGRWYDVYAFRVYEPELRQVAILFEDISEQRREEEKLALISAEFEHRSKNMLTLIRSMVQLTDADTVEAFKDKIYGRIGALASAHDLLLGEGGNSARLSGLLDVEAEAAGGRLSYEGPDVRIVAHAVQPTSMVLHELATNATKHGALSSPEGQVTVTWSWQADDFVIEWIEVGGPRPDPGHESGMGTKIIDRSVTGQLSGTAEFDWNDAGLRCIIRVPANLAKPA
ncbi:HWE histidine kinase domain-containing protein [Methyloligella solikamskensis]|uniref:histidine kinase n=1 Tax=Methyloligella solikamskensis TaxID=1177756 RepID=A0ABW3JDZ7_9HYPH